MPLRKGDIFRLYAMIKPCTRVAEMLLRDAGRLDLTDPISKYLPQCSRLHVGIELQRL